MSVATAAMLEVDDGNTGLSDEQRIITGRTSPPATEDSLANVAETQPQDSEESLEGPVYVLQTRAWQPTYRKEVLQEWEGSVLSIEGDKITVRLLDKTNPTQSGGVDADELSELSFEDLPNEDRPLVRVGAVFSWYIGHLTEHGTRFRVSEVRFRRLPGVYARDVKTAAAAADELMRDLEW